MYCQCVMRQGNQCDGNAKNNDNDNKNAHVSGRVKFYKFEGIINSSDYNDYIMTRWFIVYGVHHSIRRVERSSFKFTAATTTTDDIAIIITMIIIIIYYFPWCWRENSAWCSLTESERTMWNLWAMSLIQGFNQRKMCANLNEWECLCVCVCSIVVCMSFDL